MSDERKRVVTDSMQGLTLDDVARWSERVVVVLGQNPGPFTGPGTNTYLIGTGRRRTLLDTGQGVGSYLDLLERTIEDLPGVEGIDQVVVTHAHPDHIGGVEGILKRFGEVPVRKMPRAELDRGLRVDELGDDAVVTTQGATLRAVYTPGHASDHLCFLLEEERVMFTGDVVLGAGTTVIPRDGDLGDYMASLARLLQQDMLQIYPAHGPAVSSPHAKVREYIAHRELRDLQISSGLGAGRRTTLELVRAIYTDIPEFLYPAAQVSVEAHLRRMEKRGRVRREGDDWIPLA